MMTICHHLLNLCKLIIILTAQECHFMDGIYLMYCVNLCSSSIGKCSADIHFYVLREAHLLHRAGLYSTHDVNAHLSGKPRSATARPLSAIQQFQIDAPPITLTSPSQQQAKDNPLFFNQPMNSYECLMEAIHCLHTPSSVIDGAKDINDVNSPYIGPETYHRFLVCFSSLFKEKHLYATKLKKNLRYVKYYI